MPREILIHPPDGHPRTVVLEGERITVGRSTNCAIHFPDDAGLSRQHFCFEPDGEEWTVQDLGSKNGTYVNDVPLKARLRLKCGDRISAGHLAMVYGSRTAASSVVVFEAGAETSPPPALVTDLRGALTNQTIVAAPTAGASPVQALIRAGQELAANRPLDDLFRVILDLSVEAAGAQRGVVMVLEGGELVVKANKGEGFRISRAVRDRVMNDKASVLVRDTALDEAFRARVSIVQHGVRTMMAAPLQTEDRIIGLIYVDSPSLLRRFEESDLNLLTVMANVAAIRIENARLAEVERQDLVIQRDMAQAAEIQRRILPERAPLVAHADLAGYNAPCRTVGGDYYDFFPYSDGSVAVALGDVSGKGLPAALMVAGLQARLQVLAEERGDLAGMMARLNKITCANCPSNRFITFFFARYNPATGEIGWCNAGHNPPLIVRASGHVETLEGGGPVLGIVPLAHYREERAELSPGDLLLLFSDGVTEATNAAGEEFSEERLAAVASQYRTLAAAEIIGQVNAALAAFAGGAPQTDDITLLVLRRTA